VNSDQKQHFLVQLLKQYANQQVIVFTKTKLSASKLARALERDQIPCSAIHGDKSQKERIEALDAFKAGTIHALVATDVAARGLDITDLPLVINYEISTAPEDYVHRIGRTGRAGAKGIAISLIDEDETKYFDEIEKLIKKQIPKEKATINTSRPRPSKATSADDGWFQQPYQPAAAAAPKQVPAKPSTVKRKVVAALLGGFGFKATPQTRNQAKRATGKPRQKAQGNELAQAEVVETINTL